jgi:two-component sensor histidine kinase
MPTAQAEREITRLQRQQASLAAFGSFAFREPVLLNILNEAARVCAESLGVPFCKVCRYRSDEHDLLIVAGCGWDAAVVGQVVSRADETSPQGRAYVTGQPVIIPNLREANNVQLPSFYGRHGIVSTIDVIIKGLDGEPYGVLEIDSAIEHVYDEHDINFLTGFANVLAEAVGTYVRNSAMQQAVEQMRAVVQEKDRLLDEKNILAEELKHRVRNNLQLVHGMLTSHLKTDAGGDDKSSVQGIIRRVTTLSEVYEQLLGTGMGRSIDLGDYIRALCRRLPGLQANPSAAIHLHCKTESMLVDLDTVTALGMVVAELVSNSYEHAFAAAGGQIRVDLAWTVVNGSAILTVRDDGVSFTEKPASKRHGVGLVRRLMQQVQGSAEMLSDSGTLWTLRFPAVAPEAVA